MECMTEGRVGKLAAKEMAAMVEIALEKALRS
jgi:hypothetical protein